MTPSSLPGIALVLLAAVLWGTTGTAQSLAPDQLSPYWIGALRLAVASAFFALLAQLGPRVQRMQWAQQMQRQAAPAAPLPRGAALLAAICVAAYNLSFFAGVKAVGVALGTALAIGSGPIWAGLLQTVLLRRLPPALWWLGTLLGVAGGAAMVLDGQGGGAAGASLPGIALCLLAGLSYAGYALVNQQLVAQVGAARANLAAFGGAALLALPLALMLGGVPMPQPGTWAVVIYLGLVATGLAYLLFSTALRRISGATAVTLALAEPVTAFVLAIAIVGERPGALAFGGLAAVLAGLLLVIVAELRGQRQAREQG